MSTGPDAPQEDKTWFHVLNSLASHWGVTAQVEFETRLLDPGVQWRYAKDVWQNAAIRTAIYVPATPLRWVGKKMGKQR